MNLLFKGQYFPISEIQIFLIHPKIQKLGDIFFATSSVL